jgi:Tol biopolymer transport system component
VFCVDFDGTGLHPLTDLPIETSDAEILENGPVKSPDGTLVAFNRIGTDAGVCVINSDGTNERRAADGLALPMDWSPDGSQFVLSWVPVLSETGETSTELAVIDADGSSMEIVSDHPDVQAADLAVYYFPRWSPDGTRILFQGAKDGGIGGQIAEPGYYIVNPDGSGLEQVNTEEVKEFFGVPEYAWSPDGSAITARTGTAPDDPESVGIFNIPLDGGEPARLIPVDLPPVSTFAWSPDGSLLAFSSGGELIEETDDPAAFQVDLYTIEPISGELRRITNTPDLHETGPTWSSDGEKLIYSAFRAGIEDENVLRNVQLMVVELDGTDPVTVIEQVSFEKEYSLIGD